MSTIGRIKRFLLGKPIATKRAHHERLPIIFGLPVFASDALSSVAYATEEILIVLKDSGPQAFGLLMPVVGALSMLMLIVAFSYFQTIQAYPSGGGTYIVSTENLGSIAGRIAAASLLIDYVLTVAVSVSSGVSAIVSMYPPSQTYAVWIGCFAILVLCIANLRGAKESGILFAVPTYTFVALVLILAAVAISRSAGTAAVTPVIATPVGGFHAITLFVVLRAFAASCTALTGTEAIADGVQAFKPPEARNASMTLVLMVVLLLSMFLGVSWAALQLGAVPMHPGETGYKTVLAQIAAHHLGEGSALFITILISAAAILFLAANTAFADFPRLCSFVARDGYMPRQLLTLGDRLVFQNGIIVLSIAAAFLVVVYHADTHSLIPLYAMGVFISFTLSQAGMAVKFYKNYKQSKAERLESGEALPKRRNTLLKMALSGFGGLVTFTVTIILLVTKWSEGAWLIAIALAVMLAVFSRIQRHYHHLAKELNIEPGTSVTPVKTVALLLVPRLHKGILKAIAYARSASTDCRALHVTLDPASAQTVKQDWAKFGADMPLVILDSPYRSLVEPVLEYIDQMTADEPALIVTVIVPQAVPRYFWQGILHTNAALGFKLALASRPNVVVTNIRYFIK